VDQPKQKSTTPTMAAKKTKKEQAAHRKVALQKQLAAEQSKVMDPKVSLHDSSGNNDLSGGIEEAAEASGQTTGHKEGSIQSNKDSKRKYPPPTSIHSYTHTKRPKKLVSSEKSNKQRTSVPDHVNSNGISCCLGLVCTPLCICSSSTYSIIQGLLPRKSEIRDIFVSELWANVLEENPPKRSQHILNIVSDDCLVKHMTK
jgi:hypothetical protein